MRYGQRSLLPRAAVLARVTLPFIRSEVETFLGGKLEDKRALAAQANPITHADRSDPPFLIMHGDADPLVALRQSRLLYEVLKATGSEVIFCVVKGGSHVFAGPDIDRTVDAFFDKHLKKDD